MTNPVRMMCAAPVEAVPAKAFVGQPDLRPVPRRRAGLLGIGLLILAGLAPAVAPHPAWAQGVATPEDITVEGGAEVERIAVPYHRAELAYGTNARYLMSRIDQAALTVCGDSPAVGLEIRRAIERSDCRRDAVMRAVRDVNDANLYQVAARYDLPQ
ncbi:UrcA family protein [Gluconacetobacter takamatsuzukensis]|uniref:UrcA family protein n=1 Tax=Gluconacetobacter takamatsuzukensis TaxID=1286190 RepID=A0A7W4KES6_9PROT|nr:UrcA family protein [Gluconacetobacter takamatsuzukensis]MBB2205515.1 UrcA family protein [Gluconacetobacter takamatsuzukensis]